MDPTQPPYTRANAGSRLGRWFRYLVSGGTAALVYMGVTSAAHAWFDIGLALAGVIGYVTSMPCAYLLHRHLSFGSKQLVMREIPKFVIQSIVSAVLSGLLPWAISRGGCPLPAALVITSISVPVFNYIMLSCWVFRTK